MKRDFDELQPTDFVNKPPWEPKPTLWVSNKIIDWCPWGEFRGDRALVRARLNEIEGVIDVQDDKYQHGYDLTLDDDMPEAYVKLRILKAIDFWGIFPDAWDGGRASVFMAWCDEVRK